MKIPGTRPNVSFDLKLSDHVYQMGEILETYRNQTFKILGVHKDREGTYRVEELLQQEELEIAFKHYKFLKKYGMIWN